MTKEELHDLYVKTYDKEFNKQGYTVDFELSLSLIEDLQDYLNALYQKGYNAGRAINT